MRTAQKSSLLYMLYKKHKGKMNNVQLEILQAVYCAVFLELTLGNATITI